MDCETRIFIIDKKGTMKLKKEKEALQMFCDDESFREIYRQPGINDKDNGRVMASEAAHHGIG